MLTALRAIGSTAGRLTCYRVGGRGAGGGAGGADHAGVTAAGSADAAGAGAAVAAPLPSFSGAASSLPGAVLSDVVPHLERKSAVMYDI